VSEWAYVAIAYTVVWGALAAYALVMARRVTQARKVERQLRDGMGKGDVMEEQNSAVCDVPPAH
jgi:hypothetical protein